MVRFFMLLVGLAMILCSAAYADEPEIAPPSYELAEKCNDALGLFRRTSRYEELKSTATELSVFDEKNPPKVSDEKLVELARVLEGGMAIQNYQETIYKNWPLKGDVTVETKLGFGTTYGRFLTARALYDLSKRKRDESKLDESKSCLLASLALTLADPFSGTQMLVLDAIKEFGNGADALLTADQCAKLKEFVVIKQQSDYRRLKLALDELQAMIDSQKGTREEGKADVFLENIGSFFVPSQDLSFARPFIVVMWQFKCLAVASEDPKSVERIKTVVDGLKTKTRDSILLTWLDAVMTETGQRPIMPAMLIVDSPNDVKAGRGPMD